MIRTATVALVVWLITQVSFAMPTPAAELRSFDVAGFAAAQDAGRPILVDIAASWCPTCKAQKPIIESLAARPEYAELLVLHVDFDTQKEIVRGFGARSQSTLIAFRGRKETARSVGDTNPGSIEALMKSAILE